MSIPITFYSVPILIVQFLLAYSSVGDQNLSERKTSRALKLYLSNDCLVVVATISAIACTMFSLHTIAYSTTVVATNVAYRKRISRCILNLAGSIRRPSTIKESSGITVIVFKTKTWHLKKKEVYCDWILKFLISRTLDLGWQVYNSCRSDRKFVNTTFFAIFINNDHFFLTIMEQKLLAVLLHFR